MHPVIFVVATIFLFLALIVTILGLSRMSRNDSRARATLVGGYFIWLLAILLTALLYVVFSL